MRYEDQVRKICGDNWKTVNQQEKEGGYGVACVFAFIRGCRPSISDLVAHLAMKQVDPETGVERPDVTADDLITPYTRLAKNGVFQKNWGAKKDDYLLGNTDERTAHDAAWAHVAALAGGFLGIIY